MRQVPSADIVKHISDCIGELKGVSRIIEVGDVVKSVQTRYPEEGFRLEDLAQFIFNAATVHDVGLVLPGHSGGEASR